MRLTIRGAASAELPLRIFGLLAQHGAVVEAAQLGLHDDTYELSVHAAPLGSDREALIVEKLRSMVLVQTATAA